MRFERRTTSLIKKKKGRQGRSRESRKRAEENRRLFNAGQPKDPNQHICDECKSPHLVEDNGDLICGECGLVKDHHIPMFVAHGKTPKGKGYLRDVHFQQRLAKLMGKDPLIDEEIVDKIGREILTREKNNNTNSFGRTIGRKGISKICKHLGIDDKTADGWIQIRRRLGYEPYPPEIPTEIWERVKIRFSIITRVFDETLHIPNATHKVSMLERCNITNLNYIMSQLFKLEDYQLYTELAKFLPQLSDPKQPMLNNTRWTMMIDYIIKKNLTTFTDKNTMRIHHFEWEYQRMTTEDISQFHAYFF